MVIFLRASIIFLRASIIFDVFPHSHKPDRVDFYFVCRLPTMQHVGSGVCLLAVNESRHDTTV
jgi:hypothetical protein